MSVADLSLLSDEELDVMLLAQVQNQWLKVAMIVAKALEEYEDWDEDRVTARVIALVKDGKIESAGDMRLWRFSEVRLPQE